MQRLSTPIRLVLILLATISVVATLSAMAQDSADNDAQPTRQALNVDFPGGTGAEYIAAVREADADANIVVLGDLETIQMPAVRLRNADVASALAVLESLPQQQGAQVTSLHVKVHQLNRSPVYTITAWIKGTDKPKPRELETTVISMADLLGENLTPADALKAIETALELIKGDYEPAQIRFHEETGLLIARGASEQIESIKQVITQLRERANTLERQAQHAAEQTRGESRSRDAQQARAENEMLRSRVTQAETRAQLLEQEVAKLRDAISNLENEMRVVSAERDTLARQAAENKPKPGG